MSDLLTTLLSARLPRGRRCGTCFSYDPAINDPTHGSCAALIPPWGGCAANDGCTCWEPADGCGLDPGGVPYVSLERLLVNVLIRPLGDNERNSP